MRFPYIRTASTLCALLFSTACLADEPQSPKDYTKIPLKELGIEPVTEAKDAKTGFIVGGKNSTALVKKLTQLNGRSIADLEREMRPGAASDAGFLGKDEKLLDVLATDNAYVVDRLGLTHQQIALHLLALWRIGEKTPPSKTKGFGAEFRYHGRRFQVKMVHSRGYQYSPFRDGTKTDRDATVKNLDNGKSLTYSLLVPQMIERYGFYEGHGTSYRVDPKQVIEVLDFMAKPDKR
jgi:hypothetical protein